MKFSRSFLLFMFQQKTLKSGRKAIHHEPVHVGYRNLTLLVRLQPGTRQAFSLVKIPTPSGRYLCAAWTLVVDCFSLPPHDSSGCPQNTWKITGLISTNRCRNIKWWTPSMACSLVMNTIRIFSVTDFWHSLSR